MNTRTTQAEIDAALDTCAAEQVHIPGLVQPFGCLVGFDSATGRIDYASENAFDIIGLPVSDLLGREVKQVFASDLVHALNNAAGRAGFAQGPQALGRFTLGGAEVDASAFASGTVRIIQFERATEYELGGGDELKLLSYLMGQIHACADYDTLFDLTADLLRHLTGYDRVMIYKFDREFNGEIIAEQRNQAVESFMGLRFPHWDIPAQARAIMAKLPLRFIEDVEQTPVPLIAAHATLPPLDITFADCRGVATVHMEYLRNMQVRSTMTLSIVVEGALWGMVSFHHRKPRTPSPKLRELLTTFQDLFTSKLVTLIKQAELEFFRRTDSIKDAVLDDIDAEEALEGSVGRIGAVVKEVLDADGVALMIGTKSVRIGQVPQQAVLDHLLAETQQKMGEQVISDNLGQSYPQLAAQMNGCAGVLASSVSDSRTLCIFRKEVSQSVSWAGNPEKTIHKTAGTARLAPRGSFSLYLQETEGFSKPWSDDDLYFAERIWLLINSAERRALQKNLSRQQALMINELNHRVRNILALVRSVSRQARRHYGSLESYSASLESRITALAAAHDVASGSVVATSDVKHLIEVETAPYQKDSRVTVTGVSRFLDASIAPIFSLVIHELTTNAVKYGALSVEAGTVAVVLSDVQGGVAITWREDSGPVVAPPTDRGFGSSLIEQAVPHEMGGTADLRFAPSGVEADFFLPNAVLDLDKRPDEGQRPAPRKGIQQAAQTPFDADAFNGPVLLLEDNFVIAKDMKDILSDAGVKNTLITSVVADALEALTDDKPVFAILDVNLGPGVSSEPVALALLEQGVPFIFVTGYGDNMSLADALQHAPCLTKPVATLDLLNVMMTTMQNK